MAPMAPMAPMASSRNAIRNGSSGTISPAFIYMLLLMRILFVALGIAMFLLNAWFLYYMDQLERSGCKCAQGWKRTFIQFSLIAFILMAVVSTFVNVDGHWFGIAVLFQALTIAYVIVTRSFIVEVKSDKCLCAETKAFRVLDIVNMIQLVLLGVSLVAALILIVRMTSSGKGRQ